MIYLISKKFEIALQEKNNEDFKYKNYVWNKIINCYKDQIREFQKKLEK